MQGDRKNARFRNSQSFNIEHFSLCLQYGLLRWTWQLKDYLITKLFNTDILQQSRTRTLLILYYVKDK